MNESKSIVQRNKENTVEYKTVNSVKKAINKMKISTADSKDEFDEIATSIKKIDAFYEKNADRVSDKVLLKLYNSFNNVIPDFRAMILSFFVSFILLVFPYIINQVSDLQSTEISVVGLFVTMLFYYIVLLGLSIGIVFGLWAIANLNHSGLGISEDDDSCVLTTINSDDPIVFSTNVENEISYIYYGLLNSGCKREKVLSWIEKIRLHGVNSTFIKYDKSYTEMLEDFDKIQNFTLSY